MVELGAEGSGDTQGALSHGFHLPVLLSVVTELLGGQTGLFFDGTLGAGGHTRAILEASPGNRVLGVDRDPEALEQATESLATFGGRLRVLQCRFDDALDDPEVQSAGLAGALLDLGVSSHQLDEDVRGFTMRAGAALDMRMGPDATESVADFIAEASVETLAAVLRNGEMNRAGGLARRIVSRRANQPIATSDDLVGALDSHLGRGAKHGEKATLFQALRIHVNMEIEALEAALPKIRDLLRPDGVLVVISYQSMEDRIVKRAFRVWSDPSAGLPRRLPVRADQLVALGETMTRKPILADEAELATNPRARPARLRAWKKAAA